MIFYNNVVGVEKCMSQQVVDIFKTSSQDVVTDAFGHSDLVDFEPGAVDELWHNNSHVTPIEISAT